MSEFRIEHDSMGEVRVPAGARWRAQTQRAVENFPVSGRTLEPAHIAALGLIKAVAAEVNGELGVIDKDMAEAIGEAAADVADNEHDTHFPIDVFQTGSGTSSNMNANEVVASLAEERLGRPVHPNDHVNASQSSNDVFPTSIHVAAATEVTFHLLPSLEHLAGALRVKAVEFEQVVKSGRTHLMDATPVTLGQEFGGYASQIEHGVRRVRGALATVLELPWGHGRRHRHQHPARLRRQGRREAARGHRHRLPRGPRPLRGPERPGLHRRAVRPAQGRRRLAQQDRQRPPLDGFRPPRGPG